MTKTNLYKMPRIRAVYDAPPMDDPAIAELLEMHTYARPAKSKTEAVFIARYLDSISGMQKDQAGNRFIRIGAPSSPVLWSSHTDTVHKQGGRPKLSYGAGLLTLRPGETANCLGADCSAGVWVMRQMILRQIPGLYIFHAEEETGGHGSQWIAKNNPELLRGIDYAIALDRRGTNSVISHQMWRTASEGFCDSLAEALGPFWSSDSSGTFTDTANYSDLVPECTNLSVGYFNAHSPSEVLDVSFVADLLERLCRLDTNSLPVLRKPGECDTQDDKWGADDAAYWFLKPGECDMQDDRQGADDAAYWSRWHEGYSDPLPVTRKRHPLYTTVYENPELICDMLEELGISESDVASYVANRGGKEDWR